MLILLLACFVAILAVPSETSGTVVQARSMVEVRRYFDEAGPQTLAIFDVDNVLTIPAEPAFQMPNMKRFSNTFRMVYKALSHEGQDAFLNLIVQRYPSLLVEGGTPRLIQDLSERGFRPIALTGSWNGQSPLVGNFPDYRYSVLRTMGIDFSQSFPELTCSVFEDLPSHRGSYPSFQKGILYANGIAMDKGVILERFLEALDWEPKMVIFVDDSRQNLEHVEQALKPWGINFLGLEYTGAKDYSAGFIDEATFDRRIRELAAEAAKLAS